MFIVIEGLDAVGKSTLIDAVSREIGAKVIKTPSESAREMAHWAKYPQTERSIMFNDMALLSQDVERTRLTEIVLADRWYHSTFAYQDIGDVRWLNWYLNAHKIARPDITYQLLGDPYREPNGDKWESISRPRIENEYAKLKNAGHIDTYLFNDNPLSELIAQIGMDVVEFARFTETS